MESLFSHRWCAFNSWLIYFWVSVSRSLIVFFIICRRVCAVVLSISGINRPFSRRYSHTVTGLWEAHGAIFDWESNCVWNTNHVWYQCLHEKGRCALFCTSSCRIVFAFSYTLLFKMQPQRNKVFDEFLIQMKKARVNFLVAVVAPPELQVLRLYVRFCHEGWVWVHTTIQH